jgi:phosphonate transport system permease protein
MPLIHQSSVDGQTTVLTWKKAPIFSQSWQRWAFIILAVGYFFWATDSIEVNWSRVAEGSERALRFVAGFLQPDFTSRGADIWTGLKESITMTITSPSARRTRLVVCPLPSNR